MRLIETIFETMELLIRDGCFLHETILPPMSNKFLQKIGNYFIDYEVESQKVALKQLIENELPAHLKHLEREKERSKVLLQLNIEQLEKNKQEDLLVQNEIDQYNQQKEKDDLFFKK